MNHQWSSNNRVRGAARLRFRASASRVSHSPLTPPPPRRGFTLIELMVVMGIMALLSVLVAVAAGSAMETARVAHTRALIVRLNTLLMDRYESYRWRRLPIVIPPNTQPPQAAQLRCDAMRELMRMELPDCWTDITDTPAAPGMTPTAAQIAYHAAFQAAGQPTDTTYQGADCLYLIVTMGLEENDILENFQQGDIGSDPKNPSMRCFVDSWNNPIQFLRWAPGFNSPLQPANSTDRDQTDPNGVYGTPTGTPNGTPPNAQTFALYPLIYSAGPDGYYDIQPVAASFHYVNQNPPNNPFVGIGTPNAVGSPTILSSNTSGTIGNVDNIHNQEIGVH